MSIKKTVAVAVAVLSMGAFSAVSATEFKVSAGVSSNVSTNLGGGAEVTAGSRSAKVEAPWMGTGLGAWLDLTYAEVNIDAITAFGTIKDVNDYFAINDGTSYMFLNLGLLGKYPFDLGSVTVFPGVGIDYQICTYARLDDTEPSKFGWNDKAADADLSRLWIKFGGGIDYPSGEAVFFRATLLYAIGLSSKYEDDSGKVLNAPSSAEVSPILSHGLQLKLGVGFNF